MKSAKVSRLNFSFIKKLLSVLMPRVIYPLSLSKSGGREENLDRIVSRVGCNHSYYLLFSRAGIIGLADSLRS